MAGNYKINDKGEINLTTNVNLRDALKDLAQKKRGQQETINRLEEQIKLREQSIELIDKDFELFDPQINETVIGALQHDRNAYIIIQEAWPDVFPVHPEDPRAEEKLSSGKEKKSSKSKKV